MMNAIAKRLRTLLALVCLLAMSPTAALAAPSAGDTVDLIGARVIDVEGQHHRIGVSTGKVQPAVLVFLDTACPVATRYVPTLNKLHGDAQAHGVALYGVLSNPAITWQAGADFVDDFEIAFPVVLDSTGDLALRLGPRVMSESFVVSTADRVVYRGRIDDRFAAVGKLRARISSHDLRSVVEAIAAGSQPEPYETEAVGCFHHDWSRAGANSTEPGEITYTRHIAPLLEANCVECHRDGGIAPFSLEGYDNAKRWHRMVSFMTGERLMPPWRAMPGFGAFRDARRLSDHQIALLASWSENGARRGDAEDTMPVSARSPSKWRLGEPDLVLSMAEPFPVPADGEDIYRYFVIPTGFAEDKVVTALEFSPGDAKVVHHANYLMDYSGPRAGGGCEGRRTGVLRLRHRGVPRLQRLGHRRLGARRGPLRPRQGARHVAAQGRRPGAGGALPPERQGHDRPERGGLLLRQGARLPLRRWRGHRHAEPEHPTGRGELLAAFLDERPLRHDADRRDPAHALSRPRVHRHRDPARRQRAAAHPHRRLGLSLAEHFRLPGAGPSAGGQPHRRLDALRQLGGQSRRTRRWSPRP